MEEDFEIKACTVILSVLILHTNEYLYGETTGFDHLELERRSQRRRGGNRRRKSRHDPCVGCRNKTEILQPDMCSDSIKKPETKRVNPRWIFTFSSGYQNAMVSKGLLPGSGRAKISLFVMN